MTTASKTWSTVWIVGASSGIGKELALLLCEHADNVIISARSEEKLKSVAEQNKRLHAIPCDASSPDSLNATAKHIIQQFQTIDLVVYNAAVWHPMDVDSYDAQKFKQSIDVNYLGAIYTFDSVLPFMKDRKSGHVAVVASVAGYRGLPRGLAYGPTKSALNSFTESLKLDLDQFNITTTVINPGFVDTPMTAVNDFPMPFIMPAEKAAQIITKGLLRKKYEIAFPWQMVTILKLLRCLPNSIAFWLARKLMT